MAHIESITPDLMGIVSRQITPEIVRRTAAQLGEDREQTASALSASVPSVLAALSEVASSDTGAAHLKDTIDESRHASGHGSTDAAALMRTGFHRVTDNGGHAYSTMFIEDELGSRSTSIVDAVARTSGIKKDSARQIIGGVTSVTVAALGTTVGGTGSSSLRTLLVAQREEWMRRLPDPVASLFDGGAATPPPRGSLNQRRDVRGEDRRQDRGPRGERGERGDHRQAPAVERVSPRRAPTEIEKYRRRPAWLAPVIVVALALLTIPLIRTLRRGRVTPPEPAPVTRTEAPTPTAPTAPLAAVATAPAATAPAEEPPPPAAPTGPRPASAPAVQPSPVVLEPIPEPAVATSSTQALSAFLAGAEGTTPRRFALSPLNFKSGSTQLTTASIATVEDLAAVLNLYPAAEVRLESFTDNVGTPEANQRISTERSEAVRSMLNDRGVDPSRVETVGLGQDQPISSNGTAEGRAQNRRTDVVVTSR